jgi:hypothetical protein
MIMAFDYMIPILGVLHQGYDCTIDPSFHSLGQVLASGDALVSWRIRIIHNGEQQEVFETQLSFKEGRLVGRAPDPFIWPASKSSLGEDPGFFESDFVIADGRSEFVSNWQPVSYVICSAPGRKSFFANTPHKFAVPPVIDMVAAYGRYVEAYPVVWVDRQRDYGETIVMINPYNMDIIAEVVASDERRIRRIRVPKLSARHVRLERLLREDETSWRGRIQLTANNRVVTFDVKHSLSNPEIISDEEHLDPFRADPTHMPAFQRMRQEVGRYLSHRGLIHR